MVMMTTTTTTTATIDRIVFFANFRPRRSHIHRMDAAYVAHYVVVVSVCIYLPVTHVGEAYKNG